MTKNCKVLLICDQKNWAYDSIAQNLIKFNADENCILDTLYIKGERGLLEQVHADYDLIFFIGWQTLFKKKRSLFGWTQKRRFTFIPNSKIITGIHSHHSWDKRRTMPDKDVKPPRWLIKEFKKLQGVNAVSKRLTNIFHEAGLHNVVYTPNGVDTDLFKPDENRTRSNKIVAGYSGTVKHDWRKGITEIIEPSCKKAGVVLKKATPANGQQIPLDKMPEFYNDIDVYLCASTSEGMSLSVLEASACGCPVISTNVSGCEEIVRDGENGFIVNRSVDAFADKITHFVNHPQLLDKLGKQNRYIIEKEYSWSKQVDKWYDFISLALKVL